MAEIEKAYEEEKYAIELAVAKREITEREGENRLYNLKVKYLEDTTRAIAANSETTIQLAQTRLDTLEKQLRDAGKTEIEIAKAVKDEKDKIVAEELAAKKAASEASVKIDAFTKSEELKQQRKQDEAKKKLSQTLYQDLGAAVNGFFEISTAFRQQDIDQLEKNKDRELAAAGDNATQKDAINKRYARQEAELKRKQAIADKEQAAFSIILSTAQAVVKTLADTPFPFDVPLAIAVGALGAIQLGVVLAKPLPQFFKGTSDAPEGPAWVGEQGYELIESKAGGKSQYRLAAEKQITYLDKHDRVFTHQETKRMLTVNQELATEVSRAPGGSLYQPAVSYSGPSQGDLVKAFKTAIADMTIEKTVITPDGLKKYTEKQNQKTEWLNSYFSLPKAKR